MVRGASPALTRLTFRRDVRLFLGTVAAFFFTLVFTLALLLRSSLADTRFAVEEAQQSLADAATSELNEALIRQNADLPAMLVQMRIRYNMAGIELQQRGSVLRSGYRNETQRSIEAQLPGATATYYFDDTASDAASARSYQITAVAVVAAAIGFVLLLLYIPKITRPIEAMLDHAKELGTKQEGEDETAFLIESFRRAVETLKAEEEQLKRLHRLEKTRADDLQTITAALTGNMNSGFIAIAPDGTIVQMNALARELLETGGREVIGVPAREVLELPSSADDSRGVRVPVARGEMQVATASGAERTISVTAVELAGSELREVATLVLLTDVTEVRRLERRLRDVQGMADLGFLSGGIAHEFRNSLSTILGLITLARRTPLAPETEAKLAAIEAEGKELANTVSALLQLARPVALETVDTDLAQVAERVAKRVEESMANARVSVEGESFTLPADPSTLSLALENITRNGVEAYPADAASRDVKIRLLAAARAIEIEDCGSGIAEEDLPKVFQPFHSRRSAGVGLGLTLARKILILHGATLSLRSTPGEGTTIRIEFLDAPGDPSIQQNVLPFLPASTR